MADIALYDKLSLQEQRRRPGNASEAAGQDPVMLTQDEYLRYVEETRSQPAFRALQDRDADYYDGNQLDADTLAWLHQMGLGSLVTNLIKPAIDTVLGIEAKNRTDFRMVSDDEIHQDVAEAMSMKLAEAERESGADRACSDAYAQQVKTGIGWVHVTRNPDPFGYRYMAESVHRREMFWDWSAKPDMSDARYLMRQKWFPTDQVKLALPKQKDLIVASSGGWQPDWMQRAMEDVTLQSAYEQEQRMSMMAWEWRNIDQKKVALQECWYAYHVRGLILRLPSPDGSGEERVVEFDKNNLMHMAAVSRGIVKPEPAIYRKLRTSLWLGPHCLQDIDPGGNKLPYVPFWGFREDLTGVPYGLIRAMRPMQDEVNARRRKMMWLLSSKRVQVDADALDQRFQTFADLTNELSRPDSLIVLNPKRTNAQALNYETDLGLASQQFEILQEAKEGIQAVAGIFNSIMGKTDGAKSGIAVNSLVEQSSNTLGDINDNFKYSRRKVGDLLVDLLRADMSGKTVQVVAGKNTARQRTIILNQPARDEITGMVYRENDTDRSNAKVALEDVPSTPAYRAQQMMQIGEVLKSMPPEMQAQLMPFYLESTDLQGRHDMAQALRKMLGQLDENGQTMDPMVAQLKQQLQQMQQQYEQSSQSYEQAVQEASQKAQALEAQNQKLIVEAANRQGQLQLDAQKVQLLSNQQTIDQQQAEADRTLRERELGLKERDQAINASKDSSDAQLKQRDQDLKQADQEHAQILAVVQHADTRADAGRDHAFRVAEHKQTLNDKQHERATGERDHQTEQGNRAEDNQRADQQQATANAREDQQRQEDNQRSDAQAQQDREDKKAEASETAAMHADVVKSVKELIKPLADQLKELKAELKQVAKARPKSGGD